LAHQHAADAVFIHDAIDDYGVRLELGTRAPADHGVPHLVNLIPNAATPPATLGRDASSRTLALLRVLVCDLHHDVCLDSSDAVRRQDPLRQLEMAVTRKLDGLLEGDHQGLVPGGGTEPADGRLYAPGDDVRRMDWNLTARTGVPHVRTTIADRELETW